MATADGCAGTQGRWSLILPLGPPRGQHVHLTGLDENLQQTEPLAPGVTEENKAARENA